MSRCGTSRPIFARACAGVCPWMDRGGLAERREGLLAGLSGTVLEVGAGSGMNFQRYPAGTRLVAVEPEPYLCRYMLRRAEEAAADIRVVEGVAERLPFGPATFDTAVVTLTLCTVPDPAGALRELYRVVRPGGRLRFMEHVRAATPVLGGVQRVLDATVWPRLFGSCHSGRDTAGAIAAVGFRIESLTRFRFPDSPISIPTTPHILGVAARPGG